jgi:hypothetical protein
MTKLVKIVAVDPSDEFEGAVQFEVNGQCYDAFYWGDFFLAGKTVEVLLTQLEYPLRWETTFGENKHREVRMDKSNDKRWMYHCYGVVKSIKPVIADFGDFQLDLGDWSNDERIVGEYIYWRVDRLDLSRKK